ncbi:MAG: Processing peptidase [Candidatus Uhrbacteria bacterium GW2011_GWE2_40_58]|nr:MAG: Processing peptidase [Candidatus Uhrbacteria bacterium GW2011_GWF2_40_263]KKR67347.1 MAG: Processing peptidase [Candidatus Uhrbacteria bacterium GW2011_GWE2_40_58]OGL93543.1 MAG: hypothetical protein A2239_02350 [Candidatus Uhrbacteria bacterium RIFOXYA2_FULL_40_9]OGL96647.1 MAG: hypothetical protein A2332_01315 [Candidatus Uhrbacteria bacterium RIFOXYB2_FULL_41_18]HBK34725.1 hypothetical protein [Candidatus Uhrbacteria bacterium]
MKQFFTLKNGLRVHLVPLESTQAVTVLVLSHVGSRFESAEIQGASHFIEHLMFKGTERRPTTLDISRELDAVGAEFNAYTGKNATGYYVKVDATHLPLAVDLLHDMLFHSTFDAEEIDRERGVIAEELKMYEDNPMSHVEDLLENVAYEGNTLGRDIVGTRETIKQMSREAMIAYRDAYYIPANMVIVIAGKVDETVSALLEKTFSSVSDGQKEPATFEPFLGLSEQSLPRLGLQTKDTEQVQLALSFPAYGVNDKRLRAANILAKVLGGTMSSRLFISVRERKGLAYFIRSWIDCVEETGLFIIRAGLDKERLPLAMKTIREELNMIKEEGITDQELQEAKENIRGKLLLKMEDSSAQAAWYATEELFKETKQTPEEYIKEIQAVTAQEVKEVAQEILNESKLTIAGIGPFDSNNSFLKSLDWETSP